MTNNLCKVILLVVLTITVTNGVRKGVAFEDSNHRFSVPVKDKFPTINFMPSNLKIADGVYDNLLDQLAEQLSVENPGENITITANGYFPKGN